MNIESLFASFPLSLSPSNTHPAITPRRRKPPHAGTPQLEETAELPPSAALTPPSKKGAYIASLFEGGGARRASEGVKLSRSDTRLFPLAKRREKNSCFSHSEARLPSRSRKGRPQTRAFPRSDAKATSCFPKRRFHGDRSGSFGGLPSPNHPHLPPRPAAPDRYGDLRPSMASSPVIPGFLH